MKLDTRAFRGCRNLALAGVLLAPFLVPARADVSVITNGTFAGTITQHSGYFSTVNQGDNSTIPGWTVVPQFLDQGSVDWIGAYWTAPGGTQSIDLDGNTPGGIEQTVSTVSGAKYQLNFELSQNPDGGPATNKLSVITGDTNTPLSITGFSAYNTASGYENETISFTATGSSTLIEFLSADKAGDSYGAVIADVSLARNNTDTLAPEPGLYAVLGVGLSGLFIFVRRRREA